MVVLPIAVGPNSAVTAGGSSRSTAAAPIAAVSWPVVSVRIASGLSRASNPLDGAVQAAGAAKRRVGGAPADVAVVFAPGAHLAAPEATLEGVHETLSPTRVVGCGAGGVLGGGRE